MEISDFLIPPRVYKVKSGTFSFSSLVRIYSTSKETRAAVKELAEVLKEWGIKSLISGNQGKSAVYFIKSSAIMDVEGYSIDITATEVIIRYSTAAGAFYGVQTLSEILRLQGKTLQSCHIEDAPLFRRRAIYFDCSRGKVPKLSTLKSLIKQLSKWKINELQLYVENVFTFRKHPEIGKGFDPFTPEDILHLQAYCKDRFVCFVPSLASFGHMEKTLMLPAYSSLGELPGYRNMPGGTTLNPLNNGSIKLVSDLFNEFVPLFEAVDFNVCGDEPWELGNGASKLAAEKKGVGRVYLDFILKIRKLCLKHGKRMNLWSDIVMNHPDLIKDIPKDIVMLNWQYDMAYKERRLQRSNEITEAGLALVCCPGTNGWQSHGTRLDKATEVVSGFAKRGKQLGAEGLMNTDWGDAGHRNTLAVSLCSFAHSASHAWNTAGVNDRNHVERFSFHLYGDTKGNIAAALRELGDNRSGYWAYNVMNESLFSAKNFHPFYGQSTLRIDKSDPITKHDLSDKVSKLMSLKFMSAKPHIDSFSKLMLEEYALAVDMEIVSWNRFYLAKKLRNGETVHAHELARHQNSLAALIGRFSSTWLKANKKSRLNDNIIMIKAAINEISRS